MTDPCHLDPKDERVAQISGGRAIYKNEDFTRLAIRRLKTGKYVWLSALKATAALYGWDKAFPTVIEAKRAASPDGYIKSPGRRGWKNGGGKTYRISRSPKTQGYPPGLTNTFRLSNDATRLDLAQVANSTQVDWHWIALPRGGRWTRERFEQASST